MLSVFFSHETECLPGKINTDLQSRIGYANKGDKYSTKLVIKSQYGAQDAF